MTTELENEVRHAMAAQAGALPSGLAARVRAVDYRPRRRRAPAAAGVLVGAATAGTVVAVVVTGGAPAAYAGWSPTPTSAAAPSPEAAGSCQDQLSNTHAGPQGGELGSGAWQNVATDVRGPFTVALFQDDGAYAACFTSPSFTEVNQISSGGGTGASSGSGSVSLHAQNGSSLGGAGQGPNSGAASTSLSGTSSGDVQDLVQTHLSTSTDGAYTLVDGRTASGVTGVTLVRDDGQDVVATVADGWIVAWWPGTADATSVQVATASGATSESLVGLQKEAPGACSPMPPSSSSGSTGSASGSTGSAGSAGSAGSTGSTGSTGSAGGPSVCRSGGSAPSNPGNTASSSGNSGNSGSAGNSGNSGTGGKPSPG
jgi:hypothetical protein